MSETILTKGWPGPKGKCDMCREKPAAFWFGDTSVALCVDKKCYEESRRSWDQMIKEQEEDDRYSY